MSGSWEDEFSFLMSGRPAVTNGRGLGLGKKEVMSKPDRFSHELGPGSSSDLVSFERVRRTPSSSCQKPLPPTSSWLCGWHDWPYESLIPDRVICFPLECECVLR